MRHALLLILTAFWCLPVQAGEAMQWLADMSRALQERDYRGTFVYVHNGRLEAMEIVHQAAEDGEHERLLALNGEPREVIRTPEGVTCILPNSKAVMVDRSLPHSPVPDAFSRNLEKIAQHYVLSMDGSDRVSGLACRVISVKPRDNFRYGYRLWLAEDTRLPVKFELMSPDGVALEQMMYTHLEVLDELPDALLEPALDGREFRQIGAEHAEKSLPRQASEWQVGWLPDGFVQTHHTQHAMPSAKELVEHLVYSDGLATVSVYVEHMRPVRERLDGLSTMGAVNAMGRALDDHQITVVGEVPAETVTRIAESVHQVMP